MKYTKSKTNKWKWFGSLFMLLVAVMLSNFSGTLIPTIVISVTSALWGALMMKWNFKYRRQVKEEAVDELAEKGIVPSSVKNFITKP